MRVTIGLPVFNADKYIASSIMSILNQSTEDWLCIVVDDGSSDSSIDIINSLTTGDNRFKIVKDGNNLGLSSRLNQITELCQTEYLARMDADDIMVSDRIEKQMSFLDGNPDIDVVGGSAYIIDTADEIRGLRTAPIEFNFERALMGSLFIHPTIMGRSKWFRKNPYNTLRKRSEDYELWIRTVRESRFAQIDEPLIFYREIGISHAAKYNSTMSEIIDILNGFKSAGDVYSEGRLRRLILDKNIRRIIFKLLSKVKLEEYVLNKRNRAVSPKILLDAESKLGRALKNN